MLLLPKECFSWILAMEFPLWKAALTVQVSAAGPALPLTSLRSRPGPAAHLPAQPSKASGPHTSIAITIGAALQFWITRRFLRKPMAKLIGEHKLTKGVVLAVERAGTFKVTALLRIGPAPWGLENYALVSRGC
ncbi:MAG: hypothetical protein WDW36_001015 [Sanguina aurantia]